MSRNNPDPSRKSPMPKILIAVSIVALGVVLVYSFMKTPETVKKPADDRKVVRRSITKKPVPKKVPDSLPKTDEAVGEVPSQVEKPPVVPEADVPEVALSDGEPLGEHVAAISGKINGLKSRMDRVETRIDDLEKAKEKTVDTAARESDTDVEELKERVDRVEASVEILMEKKPISGTGYMERGSKEMSPAPETVSFAGKKVSEKKRAKTVKKTRKKIKIVKRAARAKSLVKAQKATSEKKKPELYYATSTQSLYQISRRFGPSYGLSSGEQRSLNRLAPGIAVYPTKSKNRNSFSTKLY